MIKAKIQPTTLLSTIWIFILLNMIIRDLHEFPTEGYIENMMALKLSEEAMLLFACLAEIPILMVLLSRILPKKANKWANTSAVLVSTIGVLYTLPTGQLDDFFFATVNGVAFVTILFTVWKKSENKSSQI